MCAEEEEEEEAAAAAEEERGRRKCLFRIVQARGVISNEMGPTRCREMRRKTEEELLNSP